MNIMFHQSLLGCEKVSFKLLHKALPMSIRSLSERRVTKRILVRNEDELQQRPLVIILGWSDGKMKTLVSPYSKMLEQKNLTTVCVTCSLWDNTMRYNTECRRQAMNVKKEMMEMLEKNDTRPIIFYNFSSGMFLYSHIMKDLNSNTFPGSNICGTILDSAPFFPAYDTIKKFKRTFVASRNNSISSQFLGSILQLYGYFVSATTSTEADFRNAVENVEVISPQLFLFAKNDEITSYERVIDFMKLRKHKGVDVSFKLWEESKHVMHVKYHKEEYEKLIDEFVKNSLKQYFQ